jgi:hypothetical protein
MSFRTLYFTPPLGPNTPDWLVGVALVVFLITGMGSLVWGYILERRYTGPYTLLAASSQQKWRWAVTLAFWETIFVVVLGLIAPIISPLPDQSAFALVCGGIWLIAFPFVVLYKRGDLEWRLRLYRSTDRRIKAGNTVERRLLAFPLFSWVKLLMTSEQRHFFEEGYSQDVAHESNEKTSSNG